MKANQLEARMRAFETSDDFCVPHDTYVLVRVDGRNFTTLTRQRHAFHAPYDVGFRDLMIGTARRLMSCGFNVLYAYLQSDEISLLLHPSDATFQRKTRKLLSILAGEASAAFSVALGDIGVFDARLSLLPDREQLADYFRWRQADARRNALNGYCYWLLRDQDETPAQVHRELLYLSATEKKALLALLGDDFDAIPAWQKNGAGIYKHGVPKVGIDPRTGEQVAATRHELKTDFDLPTRDAYVRFINTLVP